MTSIRLSKAVVRGEVGELRVPQAYYIRLRALCADGVLASIYGRVGAAPAGPLTTVHFFSSADQRVTSALR